MMKLRLIVADNCPACERTKETLISAAKQNPNIDLIIERICDFKKQSLCIVPALLINDELFSYGEIDKNQISEIIKMK